MSIVQLNLNKSQLKKAIKGVTFQVKPNQSYDEMVTFNLKSKQLFNRFNRSVRNNTGFRFINGEYELINENMTGGNVFRDILKNKNVQNLGKDILRIGVNKARDSGLINQNQADVARDIGNDAIDSKITSVKRKAKLAGIATINGLGIDDKAKEYVNNLENEIKRIKLGGKISIPKFVNDVVSKIRKAPKQIIKSTKAVWKPAVDPKIALALATGDLPLAGAFYTANVINDNILNNEKITSKIKDKRVVDAMKKASDMYELYEIYKGRPVDVAGGQLAGAGDNVRINIARPDLIKGSRPKGSQPKSGVHVLGGSFKPGYEGGGFIPF